MAFAAALPKFKELKDGDIAATFVVPAPGGCNLNCSFCVIRLRREASVQSLALPDYVEFVDEMCRNHQIALVSLQGYEPLLPESWEYSEAILKRGREFGIDTALVTNGTHLAERVSDLADVDVTAVVVSLDSADPALHDLTRGTPGAFAATVRGLQAACASPLRDRLMVASVLQREKVHYLWGMPQLLASLGIQQWVVTPVYKIGRSEAGIPSDQFEAIVFQLRRLNKIARKHGLELFVDDEFGDLEGVLDAVPSHEEMRVRRIKKLSQVVRLSPNGACSIGEDILRRADAGLPTWQPGIEAAGDFIRRIVAPKVMAETASIVSA